MRNLALCGVLLWVFLGISEVGQAQAAGAGNEPRVALVIGNDDYRFVTKLQKAVNDGKAMTEELRRAGFEVIALSNADRRAMNNAINNFKDKISNGGIGVLFFAGHGVQVDGTNFLLPVDVEAGRTEDLETEAINVPLVMERIAKANARFTLLILDACRDNPFPKKAGRSIGGARGMSMQDAPKGLMVLYSAGANQQALDRLSADDHDPNGLFTREFIKQMRNPNLRVDELLRKVRQNVAQKAEAVRHEQNPALYEQATGDFYLYPAAMRSQKVSSGTGSFDPQEADLVFWNSVKDSNDPADLKAYLDKFPKGQFAGLAKRRVERLAEAGASREPVSSTVQASQSPPAANPRVMLQQMGITWSQQSVAQAMERCDTEAINLFAQGRYDFFADSTQAPVAYFVYHCKGSKASAMVDVLATNGIDLKQDFFADKGRYSAKTNLLGLALDNDNSALVEALLSKGMRPQREYGYAFKTESGGDRFSLPVLLTKPLFTDPAMLAKPNVQICGSGYQKPAYESIKVLVSRKALDKASFKQELSKLNIWGHPSCEKFRGFIEAL